MTATAEVWAPAKGAACFLGGLQGFPVPPARSQGRKSHCSASFELLDLPEVGLTGQCPKASLWLPGRVRIKQSCFSCVFIPHGQVPVRKMELSEPKCSWVLPLLTFSSCWAVELWGAEVSVYFSCPQPIRSRDWCTQTWRCCDEPKGTFPSAHTNKFCNTKISSDAGDVLFFFLFALGELEEARKKWLFVPPRAFSTIPAGTTRWMFFR